MVLIPLLVDDPLWEWVECVNGSDYSVLIPLLVDDPLWVFSWKLVTGLVLLGLNPSFSGWPSLGATTTHSGRHKCVLIPLLVDDPLWVLWITLPMGRMFSVLIPLLVDDPLWVWHERGIPKKPICLNPSFSGWPSLGLLLKILYH